MSQENVELVRSIVAAHARGDYSSSEWAHPDIEYSIVGGLFSGDWKGRAGMARAARELFSTWKDHRSLVDEIRPLDSERMLVLSHVSARAKKSGIELDATQTRTAALWQVRDGEDTLAFYVLHGRGRQSGAEVAMPLAQVVRWRDGLVVYFKVYAHREDALRDLGVSEDELEPISP